MTWFAAYRQDWIRETLRIFGFINRRHLVRKFGMSVPQASHDLSKFARENPDIARYCPHRKAYINPSLKENQ